MRHHEKEADTMEPKKMKKDILAATAVLFATLLGILQLQRHYNYGKRFCSI